MSDRRRLNGPAGPTSPAAFLRQQTSHSSRVRKPKELRKIFLKTGLIPSASGSSYFELEAPRTNRSFLSEASTIKLSCTVHGPKPLPRNAPFSPNLQLTASIKFAPFATKLRRGYVRDATERDLGVHLENALKSMILPDRWPKSALDVSVIVLEAEDMKNTGGDNVVNNVKFMNILSGSITAASAALVDAKIDALDIMSGGVAALATGLDGKPTILLDPTPIEHETLLAAGVVGYLPSRDEVAEIWTAGDLSGMGATIDTGFENLLDESVLAAKAVQAVIKEAVLESIQHSVAKSGSTEKNKSVPDEQDVEMKT